MNLKDKVKVMVLGYKATEQSYLKYLRKKGIRVGKGVRIFRPFNTNIDIQNPNLLVIGDYVQMTGPVTILTHDYSWSVLKRKYGYIYGNQQLTSIGNNVFIGWGATILGGSQIGNNVIIGANSVVTGRIESNSVYAGNPARKIMTLEQFRNKREKKQLSEAKQFVLTYKKSFGSFPPLSEMDEYFFLFHVNKLDENFERQLHLMGNYKFSDSILKDISPKFKSYQDFLKYCVKEEK